MSVPENVPGCNRCANEQGLDFDFSMAFQPIIDLSSVEVWGWEALVRGMNGEGAAEVLARVNDDNRYRFDQCCRVRAIELAHTLNMNGMLSINFLPNAVYEPRACIRTTVQAANRVGFPLSRIQFEITEGEQVRDEAHLRNIVEQYKAMGLGTAIDDFGAGFAGLNLLANFQPDLLKLDMMLIRNIDQDRVRRALVRGIVAIARELPCKLIAEGVETVAEARCLGDLGIHLQQGYLFARPGFEQLPTPDSQAIATVLDIDASLCASRFQRAG